MAQAMQIPGALAALDAGDESRALAREAQATQASPEACPAQADKAQAAGEAPAAGEAQVAREARTAGQERAVGEARMAGEARAAGEAPAVGEVGEARVAFEARMAGEARAEKKQAEAGEQAAGEEDEGSGSLIDQLLRSPAEFLKETEAPDLVALTRKLLLTVAAGAGIFGAVVGSYRGGVQVAYAAVKIPMLLVGTMAICMPAFVALSKALEARLAAREVVAVTLGACARFALVLAGLSPVLWLVQGWLGYHSTALAVAGACAVAGVAASGLLFRGLSRRGGGVLAGLAFIAVFGVVGAQTSWLLRPFLVRPRTTQVPFLRPLEGDLMDSVRRSSRSAAGIYDGETE